MSGHIDSIRIARVDDDMVDEQPRNAEVVKQAPGPGSIRRGVDLAVEGAEIEPVGIAWINDERPNIAALWTSRTPVI